MGEREVPIAVDGHGSGLYRRQDGSCAWVDKEHPEDRWIRDMCESQDARWQDYEREQELELARQAERDRWAEEDDEWPWRRREKPSGLMYHLPERTE